MGTVLRARDRVILSSCADLFSIDSGLGNSSPVGPSMVTQLAEAFLDTMYKA